MKLSLISCEVFYREMSFAISRSPHQIDVDFLPKGLHDIGCAGMRERLQSVIDRADTGKYDAILLGYGLCNNGIAGLRASHSPLVIPRAHDCMTLFLGSSDKYLSYFNAHPGTYFLTSGWIEHGEVAGELGQLSIQHKNSMDMTLENLVERYGEENGRFLHNELCNHTRNYTDLSFIEMGIEPDDRFCREAQRRAEERKWAFHNMKGDLRLILRLVDGTWDDKEFLVVQPGHCVVASHAEGIIDSEPAGAAPEIKAQE